MWEDIKQDTEIPEETEKVLVPVRRHEVKKEAEQTAQEEPHTIKQGETPRRWYTY